MILQTEQTLYRLDKLNAEQRRISYQTSTGKVLEKGSDNAVLFAREIYIEDKIKIYTGLKTQIEKTNAANDVADSSMEEIKGILKDAGKELLKASTATTTTEGKKAIALNLSGMKKNILDLVNTKVGGEYLFAGSDGSVKPFSQDETTGVVSYEGDNLLRQVAIEYGSYRERGINGISAMYYPTDTATKSSTTLDFKEGQRIFDQDGFEWKLNSAKTDLVKYDYSNNVTTTTKPVTSAGTPPSYSFDLNTLGSPIPDGTKFEAKTSIFDMFDNVINALKGVDSTGASVSSSDSAKIVSQGINDMTSAFDAANVAHAELGARNKAFEISFDSVSAKLTQYDILSQEMGAVDLAKVAVEAKALELTYTALYSTVNKTSQLSLVNFIN